MANILVVDDELGIRDLLWEILNDEGHSVELAENAAQARAARLRELWSTGVDTFMFPLTGRNRVERWCAIRDEILSQIIV